MPENLQFLKQTVKTVILVKKKCSNIKDTKNYFPKILIYIKMINQLKFLVITLFI